MAPKRATPEEAAKAQREWDEVHQDGPAVTTDAPPVKDEL